jgi:hypothetical protein
MNKTLKKLRRSIAKRRHLLGRFINLPVVKQLAKSGKDVLAGGTSYEAWMRQELAVRASRYPYAPKPGLLSLISTVWNTDPYFLKVLTESIFRQQTVQPFEWVVLDNGSHSAATRTYLETVVRQHPSVKYLRVEQNLGIIGGMRLVMEQATGRYIVPVDSDDYLYPDAISIMASMIQRSNYPSLLYSDEDHLLGNQTHDAYFKPDWDPVLFSNSCYIAHLCAIDRRLGESLEIYSDRETNGSHDWDSFTRFVKAGHTPVHIPEVLYSWRMHQSSCAGNIGSKDYIYSSQQKVLRRYLDSSPEKDKHSLELSPLFKGTPDWRFVRQQRSPCPLTAIVLGGSSGASRRHKVLESFDWPGHVAIGFSIHRSLRDLSRIVARHAQRDGLVAFVSESLEIQHSEWAWQALGLMELHSDLVLVGGRICSPEGTVTDAGRYFGYGRGCDCPDRGRPMANVGYHAQMHKERSVDAVSLQLCVFKAEFLADLLANRCVQNQATLFSLAMWAGAVARRNGARVAYSPFLAGRTSEDWQHRISEEDQRNFVRHNADVLCDSKYYPAHCDVTGARAYQESTYQARRTHLDNQFTLCGVHPQSISPRRIQRPILLTDVRAA